MIFKYFQHIAITAMALAGVMATTSQALSADTSWIVYQGKYGMNIHLDEDKPAVKEWIAFSCTYPSTEETDDEETSGTMDLSFEIDLVLKDSPLDAAVKTYPVTVWFESNESKFSVEMNKSNSGDKRLVGKLDISEELFSTLSGGKSLKVRIDNSTASIPISGLEEGVNLMLKQCWPGAG